MIRKILIHIGFHKTATSTIKHSLIENDQQLRLRGVLYPQSGRRAHNHHDLALQLNEDPRFMPKFGGLEELVTEINLSNPVKVIISSEHLSISTPERISQLKKWLDPLGEIKIIAFVRRQDLWLQSLWA